MKIIFGIFLILHGLVHIWYVVLSQGWVKFQAEMGWTGNSLLLTGVLGSKPLQFLATIFYSLAAIAFVISGVGVLAKQNWSQISMIVASIISIFVILIFWDGKLNQIVEKGLLGLLISVAVLVSVAVFEWPSF